MRPLRKMLLLLQIVAFLSISFFSVRIVGIQGKLCLDNGNYTAGDSFQYSLDYLLGSIATTNSSTLNDDGLFNASTSVPQSSDVVEVMGYCRGDQTPDACRSCLNIAAFEIRQMCPQYKQAVLFRDECTLKYSNGSMYGVVSDTLYRYWDCGAPATNWDVFKNVLKQLLDDLGGQAASGGPRKYAQGNSSADLYTLYAAATCSPDLSDQQCSDCLVSVTGDLKPGCSEGYARAPSCQVAYNNSRFFNSIPAAPFPSPSPETGNKSSSKVWVAVGISAPSAVLIGVAIFLTLKWKRNPRQIIESRPDEDEDEDEVVLESLWYNLDTITDATDNFSEANKLGQGGFGSVFLTQADTSRIVGTHGYMAPEYITQGQFSIKSDVFSFGVLVLETVSGRRNLSFQVGEHREVLISRVWRNWCEGKISSIIDPLVKTGYALDIVRHACVS
ncbi:hypothetical protein MLD38_036908 [Melastoma candidum]|uniref:Uncharacterized protein n=1 Tax=Melastoma candidum TaxID=119954 RepID=A0ACB9LM46_9MYRT|nr:hypothetical protein MLD38_036908 [Melastoma candidum]